MCALKTVVVAVCHFDLLFPILSANTISLFFFFVHLLVTNSTGIVFYCYYMYIYIYIYIYVFLFFFLLLLNQLNECFIL